VKEHQAMISSAQLSGLKNDSLMAQMKDIRENRLIDCVGSRQKWNIHWLMSCNFNRRFRGASSFQNS
jgi:hypothetical protein